jgi:hypothetical protein
MHRTRLVLISIASFTTAATLTDAGCADTIEAFFDTPSLDRWMYPFNGTPGERIQGSTFGAFLFDPPTFDNRDGQVLFAFDTASQIESGLGEASYTITSAEVVMQVNLDLHFIYDPTPDPYNFFLDPDHPDYVADEDPGQPLELFGTGYRGGYTTFTFPEDGPFGFGDPTQPYIRNAFALGFDEADEPVDVSNSVLEEWDPKVWAYGIIEGVEPGQYVPTDSLAVFEIDVADPNIQWYLQTAVNNGKLDFCLTSHTFVDPYGGDFPSYYLKENPLVIDGFANAAQLALTVEVDPVPPCPADLDGDGDVDTADLLLLLGAWGTPDGDVDGDGDTDTADLLILLGAWGPCP